MTIHCAMKEELSVIRARVPYDEDVPELVSASMAICYGVVRRTDLENAGSVLYLECVV